MANKIDKINVGGANYEINLPTTATPSITSLTVGGNLTVSGTSVLASVSCTAFSCSESASIRYINSETLTVQNATVRIGLMARSVSCSGFICPTLQATLTAGSLTVPTTSGTLALTSDIPTFSAITVSEINMLFI